MRYFAVSVAEPRWLDEAFMKIFRIAAELPGNDNGLALGAVAAQRRTVLFSDFESVFDRGGHCADYLQFTNHGSFHLHELAALQAIDTDRLQKRARHLTRTASHMVKVFPSASPGAARTARPVLHAAAAIETHLWQAPVEPAEAGRPLSLPEPRRPPAVTELQLPNGMRVVMSPGFLQPVIEARLVFPRGSFNSGAVGPHVVEAAAALLDHNAMLSTFKDVLTLDWVMRLGSLLSYDVGEATTFTVRGSSTFADWHVWRLHWLLESGTYDPVDVARAREAASKAAARDRASRRDTNARWRRAIREALFGRDHPYARDPVAPRRSASRISRTSATRTTGPTVPRSSSSVSSTRPR